MTDDLQQETIDYVAICRVGAAYADYVTRRVWPKLDELFAPDATITVDTVTGAPIELTGAKGVGDFIAGAVARFEFFELVILNTTVELRVDGDADSARGRLFTCELRQDLANGHWSNAFGVYHDEYRRTDDRWRFARRRYQSLARTGRAEIFPFPQHGGFD